MRYFSSLRSALLVLFALQVLVEAQQTTGVISANNDSQPGISAPDFSNVSPMNVISASCLAAVPITLTLGNSQSTTVYIVAATYVWDQKGTTLICAPVPNPNTQTLVGVQPVPSAVSIQQTWSQDTLKQVYGKLRQEVLKAIQDTVKSQLVSDAEIKAAVREALEKERQAMRAQIMQELENQRTQDPKTKATQESK